MVIVIWLLIFIIMYVIWRYRNAIEEMQIMQKEFRKLLKSAKQMSSMPKSDSKTDRKVR
jgi:hypothetical protein